MLCHGFKILEMHPRIDIEKLFSDLTIFELSDGTGDSLIVPFLELPRFSLGQYDFQAKSHVEIFTVVFRLF